MATATAIIEQVVKSGLPSTVLMDIEATAIVIAYQSLKRQDEIRQPYGLEFGRLCYNFRERTKRPDGFRVSCETQSSFDATLDRLNVPRATAYRWITRYEESIGVRKPKVTEKPVQSVQEVPEPQEPQPLVDTPSTESQESQESQDIFAEALALPDAEPLAPKQEYPKNERGIKMLKRLASEVSSQYAGEVEVKGTSGADNLPVTMGRYNLTLSLKGVSMQKVTNALKALKGE